MCARGEVSGFGVGLGGSGLAAAEREGNTLHSFKDFGLNNGSRRGHNMALTVLFVPNSIDGSMGSTWETSLWFRVRGYRSVPCMCEERPASGLRI